MLIVNRYCSIFIFLPCCFKQASAFEGQVFTHSDVKPGMVIRAKVIALDSFSAIVQFPGGVKALCPIRHMSEFEIAKPGKKFKVISDIVYFILILLSYYC